MKFLYTFDYINNFTYHFILNKDENTDEDEDLDCTDLLYKLKFVKKNIFNKKTNYGIKHNIKLLSLKRNKNLSLNNLLINSWIKKGLKLNFLKNYNIFLERFFFLLTHDKQFFQDQPNFEFVYDLLRSKNYNYNLIYLLLEPMYVLEHMFDLKLKKLNKKMKKKYKKKYIYTVKYLHISKRLKNTLSMFYFSSNSYNHKKYYDRIFFTFLNIIFNTKNTPIWNRKLNVYKIALKFLKKK